MFIDPPSLPGQHFILAGLITISAVLLGMYLSKRRDVPANTYNAELAWLRAGMYFCACVFVATWSGVLATVLTSPLATGEQLASPMWWALTLLCVVVVFVGYTLIWPRGTFTDNRRLYPVLAPAYGLVWGACQALLFLTIWAVVEQVTGMAPQWLAIISYFLISGYNATLHSQFWDIQVTPPHNYSEWNAKKILLCHTPNLVICLIYLAIYENAAVFILLQAYALAASAIALRFPAPWDDYSAEPGQERSLSDLPAA